jgi:7-cyano-7-deazaguanine synthase
MGDCTILLSGGIDSAVAGHMALEAGWSVSALWVDLGQPPAEREREASIDMARWLGCEWREVTLANQSPMRSGEIPGRNDLLLAIAMFSTPGCSVALGIHGGTRYADCSPAWLGQWQMLVGNEYGGHVGVLAPLLHWSKLDVIAQAQAVGIPLDSTYSCEQSNLPCGDCASCLDRIGAGLA